MNTDRASRFQVFFVPCTFETERAQLESNLRDGDITEEDFHRLLRKLERHYGREPQK